MKLLSVLMARSLWLFPTAEVNPRGQHLLPLIPALIQRYSFADTPDVSSLKDNKAPIAFRRGHFETAAGHSVEVDLAVYRDGLVGDTRSSTDATDEFLEDLLSWTIETHNLHRPHIVTKGYVSNITFTTDGALGKFHRAFSALSKSLSAEPHLRGASFELSGLTFGMDPAGNPSGPTFRIERAADQPFDTKRYFSTAPLTTARHLELLSTFLHAIE